MREVSLHDGKKEDIVKVLNLSNGSFLFIGQKGAVITCNSCLEYQTKTILDLCSKSPKDHCTCRKMRMATFSITDATYLEISRHYCLATSNRTLHFLHVTSSDQWETFRLTDMPTIPISLENNFKETRNSQTRELFVGDHVGNIYIFTFLFPRTMLFDRSYTTDIQTIHFEDLMKHRDYVICRKLTNVHGDFVDKILFITECDLLLSNAKRDSRKSLISHYRNEKSSYSVLYHKKGVTCFDADDELGMIATGSKDFLIRTWSICRPHKKVSTMDGHCGVIADVRFWTKKRLLMSICKELELKIWNATSGRLLHSILMKFTKVQRLPYFGKSVLHLPQSNPSCFLVSYTDACIQVDTEELSSEDKDIVMLSTG